MVKPDFPFSGIEKLPIVDQLIAGMVEDTRQLHTMLLGARPKPYVLDEATLTHAKRLMNERLDILDHEDQQLERWRQLSFDGKSDVKRGLDSLEARVGKARTGCRETLSLIAELETGTIDRIMTMDDAELGLAVLTGQIPRAPAVTLKKKQLRMASKIDKAAKPLVDQDTDPATFLRIMTPYMNDFKFLIDKTSDAEFNALCQRYDGFYIYSKLLEGLAEGISSGDIPVS